MKNYVLLICFMMTAGMVSAQALKVASNSNVGIGVASPSEKLEVAGKIKLSSAANTNGLYGNADNKRFEVTNWTNSANSRAFFAMKGDEGNASSGQFTLAGSYVDLKYGKANGNFGNFGLRLTSAGDVGIGTLAPTEKLHVTGNIFATGTIVPSDNRLKIELKSHSIPGIDELKQLDVKVFKYNGKAGLEKNSIHYGVMAQDLQKVAPSIVSTFIHQTHDDETNEVLTEEEYLKIDMTGVQWMMLKAIQDQNEIIENLQNQVENLSQIIGTNVIEDSTLEVNDIKLGLESEYNLAQNVPNPYTDNTVIKYSVGQNSQSASINFYALNGQFIKAVSGLRGDGELKVDGKDLPTGSYSYNLVVDGKIVASKKMVVAQ